VYNIEVDGDHCYRVGRQGLLVHNASAPPAPSDCICDDAEPKTVSIPGPGGPFKALIEVNKDEELKPGQKAVCRVHWINGPLKPVSPRPSSTIPEEAMQELLFGKSAAFATDYDAGHVIAATNGGPHRTENLVPLVRPFNRGGAWRSFEIRVGQCLGMSQVLSAYMSATLEYGNTGSRRYVPTKLSVQVVFTGKNGQSGGPSLTFHNKSGDSRVFKGQPCFQNWM
jgi:hypothetical protein